MHWEGAGTRGVFLPVGATCTWGLSVFTVHAEPYTALHRSFRNSPEGSDVLFTARLHWPMGWEKNNRPNSYLHHADKTRGWWTNYFHSPVSPGGRFYSGVDGHIFPRLYLLCVRGTRI